MAQENLGDKIASLRNEAEIDDFDDDDSETKELEKKVKMTWLDRFYFRMGWDVLPLYVPELYHKKRSSKSNAEDEYPLDNFERLFVCLNDSNSCIIASVIGQAVMMVILLNIIVGVILTIPAYRNQQTSYCPGNELCSNDPHLCPGRIICEPSEDPMLAVIDEACVVIFTIEIGIRLILSCFIKPKNVRLLNIVPKSWDFEEMERASLEPELPARKNPEFSFWYPTVRYFFLVKNMIDILSIVPFYVTLLAGSGVSLSFIRVLRLLRVLRAFKLRGGGVLRVMVRSLKDSIEPLCLLFGCALLIILVFGSIAFAIEGGTYRWACDWDSGSYDNAIKWDEDPNDPGAHCRGGYVRTNMADNAIESTPFHSTLAGMYWASITMTTVGYGDLYPTSPGGRVLATVCALCGLVLMALPISILGNNFSTEYRKYKKAVQEEREYRVQEMRRVHDLNRKALEHKKAKHKYAAIIASDKACNMKEYGMDTYDTDFVGKENYFENAVFQFSDEDLPKLPKPLAPAVESAKKRRDPRFLKGYEEVLKWENEILSKAEMEETDKEDVIKLLHEALDKLKEATSAQAKASSALSKINKGVNDMEAMLHVLQKLQDAQEIAGAAL